MDQSYFQIIQSIIMEYTARNSYLKLSSLFECLKIYSMRKSTLAWGVVCYVVAWQISMNSWVTNKRLMIKSSSFGVEILFFPKLILMDKINIIMKVKQYFHLSVKSLISRIESNFITFRLQGNIWASSSLYLRLYTFWIKLTFIRLT